MASVAAVAAIVFVALMGSSDAYAFSSTLQQKSFHPSSRIQFIPAVKRTGGRGATHSQDGSAVTLYLLPTLSSISAGNYHLGRRDEPLVEGRGSLSSSSTNKSTITSSSLLPSTLSSSVLSPTDTLPQFHTAHGLLSPEVFMRIADTYDGQREGSSIHKFLKLYKSKGPMACLSMLSDGEVLPELTEAMREVSCIG